MDDLPGSAVGLAVPATSAAVSSAASITCKPVAVARPILRTQQSTHSPASPVSESVYSYNKIFLIEQHVQ